MPAERLQAADNFSWGFVGSESAHVTIDKIQTVHITICITGAGAGHGFVQLDRQDPIGNVINPFQGATWPIVRGGVERVLQVDPTTPSCASMDVVLDPAVTPHVTIPGRYSLEYVGPRNTHAEVTMDYETSVTPPPQPGVTPGGGDWQGPPSNPPPYTPPPTNQPPTTPPGGNPPGPGTTQKQTVSQWFGALPTGGKVTLVGGGIAVLGGLAYLLATSQGPPGYGPPDGEEE